MFTNAMLLFAMGTQLPRLYDPPRNDARTAFTPCDTFPVSVLCAAYPYRRSGAAWGGDWLEGEGFV